MTDKQRQTLKARFRVLQEKLDAAKRHAEEVAARARTIAGPHGVILDGETFEPLRAATEAEVRSSVAQAREFDPVGPITIDGRAVFAVPASMFVD